MVYMSVHIILGQITTLTVPVCGSHSKPPLHPPVAQELGPGFVLKSQLRRPQIRPAFQLSGTEKETAEYAGASQLFLNSSKSHRRQQCICFTQLLDPGH